MQLDSLLEETWVTGEFLKIKVELEFMRMEVQCLVNACICILVLKADTPNFISFQHSMQFFKFQIFPENLTSIYQNTHP